MRSFQPTLLGAFLVVASVLSCKKEDTAPPSLASVNIVHAVINVPTVKVNYFGSAVIYRTYTDSIKYGANKSYSLAAGATLPLTIVAMSDTTKPLINHSLGLVPGGNYSLYLAGQYPQVDTLLARDTINNYTDSLAGIRFVNLSPGSNPVSINIKNNQPNPEVTGLAYKQISFFKTYPAKAAVSSYVFELRDAASGSLLVTYTCNSARFHNLTLVLKGLTGATGTNALGIMQVNNF